MPFRKDVDLPNRLVAIEGIDRAGKSSIIKRLSSIFSDLKIPITICGEKKSPIKEFLHDNVLYTLSPFLKTYFFAADLAWTYETICLPALLHNKLVLWDRYIDSEIVYRSVEYSWSNTDLNSDLVQEFYSPFIRPALTFYIDITVETSLARAGLEPRPEPYDEDFLRRIRLKYRSLVSQKGYIMINGEDPLNTVVGEVFSIIKKQFKEIFR